MCGIAGQVNSDQRPVEPGRMAAMGARLRHRGPDDAGVYVKGPVGLAHQRLSILDLSPAGHQPMSNEDGSIWIVFNGEIYNYQELRRPLETSHTFRSQTDTEVILHLYEEHGAQCVPLLRGMFAFAIWDQHAQRLLLARDRLGKKPLFYAADETGLSFASELKALLVGRQTPAVDPVALHHYLTFQYVPAPQTIFHGIRKLLPGHLAVYEHGKLSDCAYWSLSYEPKLRRGSDEEYQAEFDALLQEAVRLRLLSDVPLGAFLSGGVDSSSVVAMMSGLMAGPVKTFSIGFQEEAYNELPYARRVAQLFGTDHHEFMVAPSALEILPAVARVYDEPYADSSAIPTYYLSELSRRHVTVVLNGDGGDELLAGYPRYRFEPFDRWAAHHLSPGSRERLAALLLPCLPATRGFGRLRSVLERALTPFSRTYLKRICYFSPEEKAGLYTADFRERVHGQDSATLLDGWFEDAEAGELLDRLLSVDTRSYLPDDLLVKVDRASMAHSLEARSPFLDHKLVEFAAALPVSVKIRNGEAKHLLKAVMRGRLPADILDRPKMGFGVPLDRWFRGDCLGFLRETLLSRRSRARGYFRPEVVERMVGEHQAGTANYAYRLYALLMLELWQREYVDEGIA
jgi:asparagine synthase (glutamine-hydrolysing)